jgi:hypothetical protein
MVAWRRHHSGHHSGTAMRLAASSTVSVAARVVACEGGAGRRPSVCGHAPRSVAASTSNGTDLEKLKKRLQLVVSCIDAADMRSMLYTCTQLQLCRSALVGRLTVDRVFVSMLHDLLPQTWGVAWQRGRPRHRPSASASEMQRLLTHSSNPGSYIPRTSTEWQLRPKCNDCLYILHIVYILYILYILRIFYIADVDRMVAASADVSAAIWTCSPREAVAVAALVARRT